VRIEWLLVELSPALLLRYGQPQCMDRKAPIGLADSEAEINSFHLS